MKTSLAARTAPDIDLSEADGKVRNFGPPPLGDKGATLTFPTRLRGGLPPKAYAATSRMAGRLNAASISNDEIDALHHERAALLDKKLNGTISTREANRLEYVRWSLDRIEDARYGFCLDRLHEAVLMQEEIAAKIESLTTQLNRFV